MEKLLYIQSDDYLNVNKIRPNAICDIYAIGVAYIK